MAKYHTTQDVEVRLLGKVKFTEDEDDQNKVSMRLLRSLMDEAEGEVERDLSMRYTAPFQTTEGGAFRSLPTTTQQVITTACKLLSCVKVLETDFGRGSAANGDEYKKTIETRYKGIIQKELKRRDDDQRFVNPPLLGLQVAYMNTSDNGFNGYIAITSRGVGDYPSEVINSPGETFWNGHLDHGVHDQTGGHNDEDC